MPDFARLPVWTADPKTVHRFRHRQLGYADLGGNLLPRRIDIELTFGEVDFGLFQQRLQAEQIGFGPGLDDLHELTGGGYALLQSQDSGLIEFHSGSGAEIAVVGTVRAS